MFTLNEAITAVEEAKKPYKVIGLSESNEEFIFTMSNDDEGATTFDKQTGSIGFIWNWDYIEAAQAGKIKRLNLEEEKKARTEA